MINGQVSTVSNGRINALINPKMSASQINDNQFVLWVTRPWPWSNAMAA
jgi:hypothetical protein